MTAEIISVGTELLLGDILNTNAQYLARELAALGIDVYYQTTVGDNQERLKEAIAIARGRCDILVFSGGLGPTDDDITKEIVAEAFDDELIFSQRQQDIIAAFFANSNRSCPVNNTKQAMIPKNGVCLDNANGTAPGAIFIDKAQYAIVLPGPPNECEPMFASGAAPYLARLSHSTLVSHVLRETGIGESHLQELLKQYLDAQNPTVALYAKTAEVHVRITAKAESGKAAEALCNATAKQVASELGDYLYAWDTQSLEAAAVNALIQNKLTVATAESCTGGLVSARLTSVPGASAVIAYGACTYTGAIKQQMLGVREQTLARCGEVSAEVAAEMARGVSKAAGSDIGIGITGIAGPTGGSKKKPVGLVYIAAACKSDVFVYKMLHTGRSRETVRENAAVRALDMIRRIALGLELRGCDKV